MNPGQGKVFLPPGKDPPYARSELIDVEGGPVECSRRSERRHRHGPEIKLRAQLLQRRAPDRVRVDTGVDKQLQHLFITLVQHRHSQVPHPAQFASARSELRRRLLRLPEQEA